MSTYRSYDKHYLIFVGRARHHTAVLLMSYFPARSKSIIRVKHRKNSLDNDNRLRYYDVRARCPPP